MTVFYKATDYSEYEIYTGGIAFGGLSEYTDEKEIEVHNFIPTICIFKFEYCSLFIV